MKMNYKTCRKILSIDYNQINDINKLQEYKVNLIDSYRYINDYKAYGLTNESIERGFIIQVPEVSLDSFIPKDKFMSNNINYAIKKISERINELYIDEIKKNSPKLESDEYRGIYYSVSDDCDENKGGYYVEFYKILDENNLDVDFDNLLDYMVIHIDNEYEMNNSMEIVKQHIDNLLIELENDNSKEL